MSELQLAYRPPIKCKDPITGNPISCDWDDITELNDERSKDKMGMTKEKEVEGGPTVSWLPPDPPAPPAKLKPAAAPAF